MANQEHVEILKQGVKTWNKWRDDNDDITPDLSGVTLRGADQPFQGSSHTCVTSCIYT